VRTITPTIDATAIRSLFTVAQPLLAAPDSGRAYRLLGAYARYQAGSEAFSAPVQLYLTLGDPNSSVTQSASTGPEVSIDQTVSSTVVFPTTINSARQDSDPALLNQALYLWSDTDVTGGNGSLLVSIMYVVLDTTTGDIVPLYPADPTLSGSGTAGQLATWTDAHTLGTTTALPCDLVGTPTCGSGCATVVASSGNCVGAITTSTLATAATLNWSGTRGAAPVCLADANSGAISVGITSVSTSGATFGLSAGLTGTIYYHCFQGG